MDIWIIIKTIGLFLKAKAPSFIEISFALIFLYLCLMFLPESFIESIKTTEYGIGYLFLLSVGFLMIKFIFWLVNKIKYAIAESKNKAYEEANRKKIIENMGEREFI
jgi:hypothetical protein